MENKKFADAIEELIDRFEMDAATMAALEDEAISNSEPDKAKELGELYEKVMAAKECLIRGEYATGLELYSEYLHDCGSHIAKEDWDKLAYVASEIGLHSEKLNNIRLLGSGKFAYRA